MTSIGLKKASFWKRLGAHIIDITILSVICGLSAWIFKFHDIIDEWFYFVLFYAYNIFMDSYYQATLGKMILRIKVIKIDGSKPDLWSSFYRNFGKLISAIPLLYGFLRILAPHQKQTIHDELGKCLVIESQ